MNHLERKIVELGCCWKLMHSPAYSSQRRAQYLRETGNRVVKPVLLRSEAGYLVALLSATCLIDLSRLSKMLGCAYVRLATPDEIDAVFLDCDPGLVPGLPKLYQVDSVLDDRLLREPYLAVPGTSRHVDYRVPTQAYLRLERPACGRFAYPATSVPRPTGKLREFSAAS